jgi:REP-associated tyrosine transposase
MKYIPFETDKYYHIYNRGNNRENIFIEDDNYLYFIKLLKKYLSPILDIYSYCLLANHFHLIVKIKAKNQLPLAIRTGKTKLYQPFSNLFNAYTKAVNKRYNRRGSLFQEHLKRKEITDENYLKSLIIYVNTNPDHHGIANYNDYMFSSYNELITEKSSILCKREIIKLFDDVENLKFVLQQKKINIETIRDFLLV